MITLTTLGQVPPFAQGLVRDLRVRWALEEAGLPYRTRLLRHPEQSAPDHLARQPFGQVPAIEEDGLVLFESGAIALHLGHRSEVLLPAEPAARARAVSWLLAALNTVEPAIQPLIEIDLFHADADWARTRRPAAEERVRTRLDRLAARLAGRSYLEDRFTVGDLMMVAVLQILRTTDLVDRDPVLAAYRDRCLERPAYQRAHRDHMAVFAA